MNNEVRIWDPLVRAFHWSLVLAFIISYATGDEQTSIHVYSGYSIFILVSLRVIWGIIGSKHARFSDFVRGKEAVVSYLKSLLTRSPQHFKGHNPAGGWMIIALIIGLFSSTLSGMKLYAVEEGLGPFANNSPEIQLISSAYADGHKDSDNDKENFWEEFWEEVHEVSVNFTLLLIFFHIGGVLISSAVHKENLIRAMITGNKKE